MKSAGGGEIVQVQGGHIVRSTGRKDRHSKVYTAKGPRDRRVRLSAHTAIQFYDVQDRLGYDRPSKAVDWLIKKAKSSIDKLAELPPWHPIALDPNASAGTSDIGMAQQSQESNYVFPPLGGGGGVGGENPSNDSAFIAPPLDSDSIADTMKSFFPTSSGTSSINYQNYPPDSNHHNEDLCLSLHSFQDPDAESNHKNLFASAAQVGYETNFQRMVSWGGGGGDSESRVLLLLFVLGMSFLLLLGQCINLHSLMAGLCQMESQVFEFQHEFRVRRSIAWSQIGHPLPPPTLITEYTFSSNRIFSRLSW
ncbi:unnamed protein product, partial [Vitis vinifera]|uniref:TCP domain-containing protein n=1 Tax=Vitis vinifera TaxID=29760 RepID=E0CTN3_VITVI